MANDLISRDDVCKTLYDNCHIKIMSGNNWIRLEEAIAKLTELPSADVVNREVVSQIQWERDTAISQLKDLGYGLGEKIRTDADTISRQAAIDALRVYADSDLTSTEKAVGADYCIDIIESLPSAQPEIIRCKDCKHWNELLNICDQTKRLALGVNGFCSMAERRTE